MYAQLGDEPRSSNPTYRVAVLTSFLFIATHPNAFWFSSQKPGAAIFPPRQLFSSRKRHLCLDRGETTGSLVGLPRGGGQSRPPFEFQVAVQPTHFCCFLMGLPGAVAREKDKRKKPKWWISPTVSKLWHPFSCSSGQPQAAPEVPSVHTWGISPRAMLP